MKFYLLLVFVFGIAAIQQGAQARCWPRFSPICCNANAIRGIDVCGNGSYGAPRRSNGKRWKHRGVDIECPNGFSVGSPIQAKVLREAKASVGSASYNTGILMEGTGIWSGFKVWMFYLQKSVNKGTRVNEGDVIGTMLDMTGKCSRSGMTNHIHLKLKKNGKLVNPEDYIC